MLAPMHRLMRRVVLLVLAMPPIFVAAQDEQEPPPAVFRVAGKVLDHEGKPVAGALVALWDSVPHADLRFLVKGTTDTQGGFDLAVDRELADSREHPFGPVEVIVSGTAIQHARGVAFAGKRDMKIATQPAIRRDGVVVDENDNPVSAAVVSVSNVMWGRETTTTDENGRYVLHTRGVPEVVGEGFVVQAFKERVVLPTPQLLALRVVDEAGGGIAGAAIEHRGRVVTITDDDGKFRLPTAEGVGVHRHRYRLNAPGFEAVRIRLKQGEPQIVAASEPFRGRVVDDAGVAIEGARITVGGPRHAAWTDQHGMFRFDTLPRAILSVEASKPGYLTAKLRTEVGVAADRITLRLRNGADYSGQVTRDDKPVMGCEVVASDGDGWGRATAYSDDTGRFVLHGVPPEAVRVHAHAGRTEISDRIEIKEGVVLELASTHRVHGSVVDDAGRVLAQAVVQLGTKLTVKSDARGRFDFGMLSVPKGNQPLWVKGYRIRYVGRHPGEPWSIVALSKLGHFEVTFKPEVIRGARPTISIQRREEPRIRRSNLPGSDFKTLPAGTYDVTIEAPGHVAYRETITVDKSVTLTPKLLPGGTLRLTASAGAKVIVQTRSGKAAPIVVMELATGKKTVRGFGPGAYRFIARAKGELIVVKEVELGPNAPPQDLDLRGGKASQLTVTVVDAAGDPVVGAKVTMMTMEFAAPPKRTDENGAATLTRLFAGKVRVTVSLGDARASRMLNVVPGRQLTLDVTLK